ncbi:hypothetical protein [Phaeodactylibacter xiamenensis]|uniref:hypothetical protein n=1 Tax=Phaeodactylibacter xiamenensis TaxID=1524460 RepID=UPI003BABAE9D
MQLRQMQATPVIPGLPRRRCGFSPATGQGVNLSKHPRAYYVIFNNPQLLNLSSYQAGTAQQYLRGPIQKTCPPVEGRIHKNSHLEYAWSSSQVDPGLFFYGTFVLESTCPVDAKARPAGRHKPALTKKQCLKVLHIYSC